MRSYTKNITCAAISSSTSKRFAVVGAGCAGLGVVRYLLQEGLSRGQRVHIDLYDAYGIGCGATGVAAGLLHPYAPTGKKLWQAEPAFQEASHLIHAVGESFSGRRFWKQQDLFRPANNERQRRNFAKNVGWTQHLTSRDAVLLGTTQARCVTQQERDALFAGCSLNDEVEKRFASIPDAESAPEVESIAGIFIRGGIVLDTVAYLNALWEYCEVNAQSSGNSVQLHYATVTSINDVIPLTTGSIDAVVLTAGAAINTIQEAKDVFALDLCQGYTVDISSSISDRERHTISCSLIGNPYVALQNSSKAIVGATQQHGVTSEDAFQLCNPSVRENVPFNAEARHAAAELTRKAMSIIPELQNWNIDDIRSGVRAIPNRNALGAMPYAGKLGTFGNTACWNFGGLGSRGLVYHAWGAKSVAQAVWADEEQEILPSQFLRWKEG